MTTATDTSPQPDQTDSDTATEVVPTTWPAGFVVLVPVYNHAAQVGEVVRDNLALGAPVLVVDDGSTDGSGDAAREAGAEVLTHPINRGKAQALQTGLNEAAKRGYTLAVACDADGQHPASEVSVVAQVAAQTPNTIVIGSRQMHVAPFISRLGKFLSNCSSWLVCCTWMGDSQSGLRAYPLPLTTQLEVKAGHYAYEIEVLIRAVWAGMKVKPVSVKVIYPEDRVSHFNKLRDNAIAFKVLFKLLCRRFVPLPHKKLIQK